MNEEARQALLDDSTEIVCSEMQDNGRVKVCFWANKQN